MLSKANHRVPSFSAAGPFRQGRLSGWFEGKARSRYGTDPGTFDVGFTAKVEEGARRVFGPGRYFDLSIRGLEQVPDSQVMVVSNHSGGTTIPDVWGFASAWYKHFGPNRPLHILAHELLFAVPPFARIFERLGVLRASRETARKVLAHDRDLLIYPGGDIETWRPYSKRYQLDFAGRTGYARLAVEMQLPIVPVAHAGAHETLRVLTSGRWLARAVGLHRLARAEVWPIHLSVPWGLALGPVPHIPLPARFRYLVGKPISPPPAVEGAARQLDRQVRTVIQQQLDELRDEEIASAHRRKQRRGRRAVDQR
jgi:1-acyl-sn-glycerol-3-phosphate acyltransferase